MTNLFTNRVFRLRQENRAVARKPHDSAYYLPLLFHMEFRDDRTVAVGAFCHPHSEDHRLKFV